MRPHLSILILAALISTACSCSEDEPKPAAPAGQRRERIEIAAPAIRETPEQEIKNSRASLLRILAQECDAITAPFPGQIEIDLPEGGSDTFASALAITGFPKDKPPLHVRLVFEIDITGPQRTAKSAVTLGFDEAIAGWSPILQPRGTDGPVKLVIRSKWIGEETPQNLPPLRMCVALPETSTLGKARAGRPNVLIVSVDTLRADHLSCYGYQRATSPHIDALLARGALFERAYSSAPWTLPSYGSLFTGLLPADHRAGIVTQRENAFGTDEAPAERTTEHLCATVPTLAELLAKSGYQTAAFVCNPFLGSASGLSRGFQQYTSYQYTSSNGVDLALEWITSRAGSQWFACLHVIDPHWPYAAPHPWDTRFSKQSIDDLKEWPPNLGELRTGPPDDAMRQLLVDQYDGEITFVDDQIGRLVDALEKAGVIENTLIVFHSDHGEEFWEHGSCDHGHSQFDELLHVPFALVLPGKIQAGQRIATRVRALDLLPTIAEYAGFAAPAGIEGKSLLSVLAGKETADRDDISEAILHGTREIKAVFVGRDKLIASGAGTSQLYDLSADPNEQRDRAAQAADMVKKLRDRLAAHHTAAKASECKAAPLELDDAAMHRLNGYGYGGREKPPKKP